jgi:hypothetical protein
MKPRIADRRKGDRRHSCWLVQNWRSAYRWISVQLAALLAGLATIYELVPSMKEYLPQQWFHVLMVAGAVGVIIGRLKNQGGK